MSAVAAGSPDDASRQLVAASWRDWIVAFVIGALLACCVWKGLVTGGGLVGGDTYPYFFPQKQAFASALAAGEWPLWNDRTSLGYPLHAESQAGVFYPSNQILYRVLSINSAYSASVVLHYVMAFVFAWRFARCQRLSQSSALLAALVFVYGWFPARVSLEWSIIGGVWFPLCLWQTDRLVDVPSVRRGAMLAICFAVHLLAGHFTLAFITQLTCAGYAVLVAVHRRSVRSPASGGSTIRSALAVPGAILVGLLLASVQLLPTIELRQLSQRDGSSTVFDPSYGHMPPVYLTQLFASWWFWHTPEMVQSRGMQGYPVLMSAADTNAVEAHLYAGLIPLGLVLCLVFPRTRSALRTMPWRLWLVLSMLAVLYSFGWFVPVFRRLPGFGFFMGPGRYTIITAFGLSLIAGLVLDALMRRRGPFVRWIGAIVIGAVTLPDLLWSRDAVSDAVVVDDPPAIGIPDSWIARELSTAGPDAPYRLLCGGPNIGNLFGVSSVPHYLGLGPSVYYTPTLMPATQPTDSVGVFPADEQLLQLKQLAVTHILTTDPVPDLHPDCELVDARADTFLNRVWARGGQPCFLYRLKSPSRRVRASPSGSMTQATITRIQPTSIALDVDMQSAGRVEWRDLMFPGWGVAVDGTQAEPVGNDPLSRAVEVPAGSHTIEWTYRPASFRIGAMISIATCVTVLVASVRHSRSSRR